jgi:hypothetical protein
MENSALSDLGRVKKRAWRYPDRVRRIVMRPSKLPANGRDWKGVIDHAFVDTGCGDAVQLFSHGE